MIGPRLQLISSVGSQQATLSRSDHNLRSWVSRPFAWTRQSSRASGLHPVFYGAAAFHAHASSYSTRRSTRGEALRAQEHHAAPICCRSAPPLLQLPAKVRPWVLAALAQQERYGWHGNVLGMGEGMRKRHGRKRTYQMASAGQQQHTLGSPSAAPPSNPTNHGTSICIALLYHRSQKDVKPTVRSPGPCPAHACL